MSDKFRKLVLFLSAVFTLAVPSLAQTESGKAAIQQGYRSIEIGKALMAIREMGSRAEDFVPPHWKIFGRADGDLNRDGINDSALILVPDDKDTRYMDTLKKLDEDSSWLDDTYMIVVVDSRGDKKLHYAAVNSEIGTLPQGERDEFTVKIAKGVLDVYTDTGGSLRIESTYHFRDDPPTGGPLTLIGYDEDHNSTSNSDASVKYSISENYLTGTRVDTSYKVGPKGDWIGIPKTSAIKRDKREFSEVR